MGILRYIFWGLLLYIGYRALKKVFNPSYREPEVKGKPKYKNLNIDKSKIEDADFEELDEK